ncbi:hypothetical protein VHEMI01588 [[Torrubiella] hemipterigena]|uniref:Fe2OG dioxygenase domain-containing protein n=1 Tax=[Torrubiella] hemipterigena TaxID=1531966 RepID=A0A0A1STG7_9HYPO|nr:hypothetical protein VHEMI01588 [[Torrubiella] hemipterigena]
MGSVGTDSIPTVDISAFISPTATEQEKQRVVDQVRHAATTYGFMHAVGHGVSVEEQKEMLNCTKKFFDLPMDQRMEVHVGKSMGKSLRGYEPSLIQVHHKGLLPDTKETFMVGAEIPPDHPDAGTFSTGPNLWPAGLDENDFRKPVMEYQAKMVNLAKVFLKILGRGLPKEWGHKEDVLEQLAENPSIPMRMLHYAPQPVRQDNQFGVADHTDFGCLTLLLQETGSKGLEVWYPPTEKWISVPPMEGAYVVNMSDMMQKWTGGYYRSARHRVITTSNQHRYSVAFFLNGNLKLKAKALDGSGEEVIIGEHIRGRLIETLGKTGEMLK